MVPRFASFAPSVLVAAALLLSAPAAQAQGPRVALVVADSPTGCQLLQTQAVLQATNKFSAVDIISVTSAGGGTPALPQLLQYHAVMCWTNQTPADNVAWGNVLADYVDAGGGVVVTVFANSTTTAGRNIAGRWQSGYMVIIDRSGNASGGGGTLGTVHHPTHPLMANVTGFVAGTIGSRPSGTALEVGSTLIAEWNDGRVLVAAGANPRRVDLGFYPPPAACSQSGWASGGDVLLANALLYVSGAATYEPFAPGCSGALGVPSMAAAPGSRPVVGTVLNADLANLPLSTAVVLLGFSNTQFGAIPLPLDLGPLGMPGCSLYTDILVSQAATGSANAATWSVPVPNDLALVGGIFFNQALVPDPAANTLGLTASNGVRGRISSF